MRRLVTIALVAAMSLQIAPLFAAGGQDAASIAGTVKTSAGRPMADATVRLRNVLTNQIVRTTMSNGAGEFGFVGLNPGTYVVEVLNASGQIIGTSAQVGVAAGAAIGGVLITAAAGTVAAAAAAGGLSTAVIIGIVGAAAGITGLVVVKNTGSPSQ